jgi:hypothetical protein
MKKHPILSMISTDSLLKSSPLRTI